MAFRGQVRRSLAGRLKTDHGERFATIWIWAWYGSRALQLLALTGRPGVPMLTRPGTSCCALSLASVMWQKTLQSGPMLVAGGSMRHG